MTGLNVDELYPLAVDEDIPDEALASDLIGFNTEGSQSPLFLIQTWDKEIFHVQRLARYLGPDQPVFSVNPPRGQRREDFPRRDSTWSQYALERLDRLGHTGPWRIGGWSFGGALSLRIAKLLLGRGEQIESVILFDAVFPGLSRSSNRKRQKNPIHRIASSVNDYYDRPQEERKAAFNQRLAVLKRRLRGGEEKWRAERRGRMGLLQRAIHVAFLNYEEFEFEGPVALFWTSETMKKNNDLSLGWHRYLRGPFFSQWVAEGHVEMWHEPHIERVAEACEIFLSRRKTR
mgnify:CR=1 FL=1